MIPDWEWVCSQSGYGSGMGLGQVWDECGVEEGGEVENRIAAGVVIGDGVKNGIEMVKDGLEGFP